jgi:hypothetical protein
MYQDKHTHKERERERKKKDSSEESESGKKKEEKPAVKRIPLQKRGLHGQSGKFVPLSCGKVLTFKLALSHNPSEKETPKSVKNPHKKKNCKKI